MSILMAFSAGAFVGALLMDFYADRQHRKAMDAYRETQSEWTAKQLERSLNAQRQIFAYPFVQVTTLQGGEMQTAELGLN